MEAEGDQIIGLALSGRYVIEKELGRGGIGAVYLARDRQLHSKPVVIKVLLKESGGNPWVKKKFRQEIEALARIDHPGVIGVLDAGQMPDGAQYLVMQFVEGVALRSAIKVEGMELGRVAAIVRQIGQALGAAHDKGVFHRDLKPENIMLQTIADDEEYVKLIDFGIATVRDSQADSGKETTEVAGTIAYMAPEQLMGKPSAASDIYALGVIAYEMVTGRRPFNPGSPYQLLDLQRAGVKVKPIDLRPALGERAQEVILKALSFEPKDRHFSARGFGDQLARALTEDVAGDKGDEAPTELAAPPLGGMTAALGAPGMRKSTGGPSLAQKPRFYAPPSELAAPNLGAIVPKTCDRREQVNEFRKSFVSSLNQRFGVPQIYVVHGDERECHDSLVERLLHKDIKPIAEKRWGEQRGVVAFRKLEWVYGGEITERQYSLKEMLFRGFDDAYMEDDLSPPAFTRVASSSLSPLIVIQHGIRAERWDGQMGKFLGWYKTFWDEVGGSPSGLQFIIFLNVIYPWARPPGWLRSFLSARRFDKKRVEAELQGLAAPKGTECGFLILKELESPRQDEVKDWFSLNNFYSEKVRQQLMEKMFKGDDGRVTDHKCMADLEHELQVIVESIQEETVRARGYLR